MSTTELRELADHHFKQGETLTRMNQSRHGDAESRARTDAQASWHYQKAAGLRQLAAAFDELIRAAQ